MSAATIERSTIEDEVPAAAPSLPREPMPSVRPEIAALVSETDLMIAVHEASHAVAARAAGYANVLPSIAPSHCNMVSLHTPEDIEAIRGRMVVDAAGAVGVRLWKPGVEDDGGGPGPDNAAFYHRKTDRLHLLEDSKRLHGYIADESTHRAEIIEAETRAEELLMKLWPAVIYVATRAIEMHVAIQSVKPT